MGRAEGKSEKENGDSKIAKRRKGRKGERGSGKKDKGPGPGQARVGPPVRGGPLGSVLRNRYMMGI